MDNNELLAAIQDIVQSTVQQQLEPVKKSISVLESDVSKMKTRIDKVSTGFEGISAKLETVEENTEITKTAANALIEWTERAAESIQIPFMQ